MNKEKMEIEDISRILCDIKKKDIKTQKKIKSFKKGIDIPGTVIKDSWFDDLEVANEIKLFNEIVKSKKANIFPLRYYDMIGKRKDGSIPDKKIVLEIRNDLSKGKKVIFPYIHIDNGIGHWVFCEAVGGYDGKINLKIHNASNDADKTDVSIKKNVAKVILGKNEEDVQLIESELKKGRQVDKNMCGGIILREMFEKALEIEDKERVYDNENEAIKCAAPIFAFFEKAKECGVKIETEITKDALTNLLDEKQKTYSKDKNFTNNSVLPKTLIENYCAMIKAFILKAVIIFSKIKDRVFDYVNGKGGDVDKSKYDKLIKSSNISLKTENFIDDKDSKSYAKREIEKRDVKSTRIMKS